MAGRLVGRAWAVFLGLGGASAWLGCNALAGIELGTLAPADGGGTGGNDATTLSDANGGADSGGSPKMDAGAGDGGGSAEAGAAVTYSCATSAAPFVVANLENATDGGRQLDTSITLGITQNQQARIVVQLVGNQGNQGNQPQEAFRAYDVQWQPKMLDDSMGFLTSQGSHVSSVLATANGITPVLTESNYDNDAGYSTIVEAYSLPANQQSLNNVPPPYPLTTPFYGNTNNQSATAIEMGFEDEFVVTNFGALMSNRASRDGGPTTPTAFASAGPQQGGSDATLVHGGSSVYAVYGGDPTSDAGTLIYKIPDNGVNTALVTPSVLPPGTVIAAAGTSSTDPTKVVTYAATLVTTPTVQFSLYAGLVDGNNFDKLQLSALAPGPSLTLHDVPANKGTSTFVGDQLVLLGLSPVAADQGLNFVWIDPTGRVLAEAIGDNRLYNARTGIQTAAIAPVSTLAGVLTTFFVAWVEEQSDAMGSYDIVYLDQLQCSAN
jgi:hypothetical protein